MQAKFGAAGHPRGNCWRVAVETWGGGFSERGICLFSKGARQCVSVVVRAGACMGQVRETLLHCLPANKEVKHRCHVLY